MISKHINGFHLQIGLLYINEKLNHHLYQRQKDPVGSIKSFFCFTDLFILSLGDASNFDDYEEEPRKRTNDENSKELLICFFFV
jgi:hypothetical protein